MDHGGRKAPTDAAAERRQPGDAGRSVTAWRHRRLRGRGMLAAPALLVAAGVAAVAFPAPPDSGDALSSGVEEEPWHGSTVDLPREGEVTSDALDDGSPVFVAHHDGGAVTVLSPVSTSLDHLVIWCEDEERFIEPIGATAYDADGEWLGGPADGGLAAYDAEVVENDGRRAVRVGGLGDPPERPSDHAEFDSAAGSCIERTLVEPGAALDAGDGVLLPHPFGASPLAPDELDSLPVGDIAVVEATLDLDHDPARLCAAGAGACGPDDVAVTSTWWDRGGLVGWWQGAAEGRFLVRVGDGEVSDLAQLRRETTDPHDAYLADLERADDRRHLGDYGEVLLDDEGRTCLADADGQVEHCAELSDLAPGEASVGFADRGAREAGGEQTRSLRPVVLAPVPEDVWSAELIVEAEHGIADDLAAIEDSADEPGTRPGSVRIVRGFDQRFLWGRPPPAEECVAYALLGSYDEVVGVVRDVEMIMPDEGLTDVEREHREQYGRGC